MNEKKAKKLRKLIFGDRTYRGRDAYVALYYPKLEKRTEIPGGDIFVYTPFTVFHKPGTDRANYHYMKGVLKYAHIK